MRVCFTVLGSSSGVPQANRNSSGHVLNVGGQLTLFDCGGGVTSSFLRRGFDPTAVDRIFISHTHPDHVSDLPLFLQMIYLAGREERVDLFVPEEFVEPLRIYLDAVYLMPKRLPFETNIVGYRDGFEFDADIHLTAIANSHLRKYADVVTKLEIPNKMQAFSFQVQVGEKRLFYSGDIGSFDDIRDHLDGSHLVVMEMSHIDVEAFFESAPTIDVGEFVVTHLESDEMAADLNESAHKAGMDNFCTAVDGMELWL